MWEEEKEEEWVKGLTATFQAKRCEKTTLNNYNAYAEWKIAKISAKSEGKQYGKYVNKRKIGRG